MRLRTLGNGMNLRGKRVLVRIDANVPVKNGRVMEGAHGKIARAAVDLEWLRQHGARIIAVSHLGRPRGRGASAYSLRPIARRLSELLGTKVALVRDVAGPNVERAVSRMKDGDMLLLENIRFDAREERNSPSLARALASVADMYVNDAFAVSHRAHTSVDAITSELPSYAGPLVVHEVNVLSKVVKSPKHPFVLVMGGLKMETKLPVLRRFLPEADRVLIGGALATAFLRAQGHEVGKSAYDDAGVRLAKQLLRAGRKKLALPVDVVVAKSFRRDAAVRTVPVTGVRKDDRIVDVGKRTMRAYVREIQKAKTIVWNGPFGYCECPAFCNSTLLLARGIASRTGKAVTVVGGGDTVPIVEAAGLAGRFTLISTGGGAMLEFLAGKKLPGLEALTL